MNAPNWTIEKRQIADLIPYDKNPRYISDEQFQKLKNSIREDGYHARAVVDTHSVIIAGHMRLRALADLGFTEAEVLVPNRELTPEEFDRINIRDNIEFGEFDVELLQDRFTPEYLDDLGLVLELEEKVVENDPSGDADDIPEPPVESRTKPGDLYEIGENRLLCGDSTILSDFEKLMNGKTANMCFTDPPWNVAIGLDSNPRHKQREGLINDKLPPEQFKSFLVGFAGNVARFCDGDIYCVLGASEWPTLDLALRGSGFHWSATIIWSKDAFVLGRSKYHRRYEPIWYGWLEKGRSSYCGARDQDDVWDIPRPRRSDEHPTMKPVELMVKAIKNSSQQGDIILEPFGGSGATMVASHSQARRCFSIELDPKYCDVIVTRMHKLYPELEIKRNGESITWE